MFQKPGLTAIALITMLVGCSTMKFKCEGYSGHGASGQRAD